MICSNCGFEQAGVSSCLRCQPGHRVSAHDWQVTLHAYSDRVGDVSPSMTYWRHGSESYRRYAEVYAPRPAMPVELIVSKPFTFGELEAGKKFIAVPHEGDRRGNPTYIFVKLRTFNNRVMDNAVRMCDGTPSHMPDEMPVLPVE